MLRVSWFQFLQCFGQVGVLSNEFQVTCLTFLIIQGVIDIQLPHSVDQLSYLLGAGLRMFGTFLGSWAPFMMM